MLEYLGTIDESVEFEVNSYVPKLEVRAEFHRISYCYRDLSLVYEITALQNSLELSHLPSFLSSSFF